MKEWLFVKGVLRCIITQTYSSFTVAVAAAEAPSLSLIIFISLLLSN